MSLFQVLEDSLLMGSLVECECCLREFNPQQGESLCKECQIATKNSSCVKLKSPHHELYQHPSSLEEN